MFVIICSKTDAKKDQWEHKQSKMVVFLLINFIYLLNKFDRSQNFYFFRRRLICRLGLDTIHLNVSKVSDIRTEDRFVFLTFSKQNKQVKVFYELWQQPDRTDSFLWKRLFHFFQTLQWEQSRTHRGMMNHSNSFQKLRVCIFKLNVLLCVEQCQNEGAGQIRGNPTLCQTLLSVGFLIISPNRSEKIDL